MLVIGDTAVNKKCKDPTLVQFTVFGGEGVNCAVNKFIYNIMSPDGSK